MAQIVLFCENCGSPFPTGMHFNGDIASIGSITSGPCRVCGGPCSISNKILVNVGGALRSIAGAVRSHDEFRELSALLQEAKDRRLTPDEVMEFLRQGDVRGNGLGGQLAAFLPKGKNETLVYLTVLIGAIQILLTWIQLNSTSQITAAEIDAIVQRAIVTVVSEIEIHEKTHLIASPEDNRQAKSPSTHHSTFQTTSKNIGRNQSCPCLSGKRHKDCCGSLKSSPK